MYVRVTGNAYQRITVPVTVCGVEPIVELLNALESLHQTRVLVRDMVRAPTMTLAHVRMVGPVFSANIPLVLVSIQPCPMFAQVKGHVYP